MKVNLRTIFSKAKTKTNDWKQLAPAIFKDSNGVWYHRFEDEMLMPIERMREMQTAIREIGNKVSDGDLMAFLDNQNKILFGNEAAEKKLELLAKHLSILKERTEFTIASPELLMNLACILYIREDEDPYVFSKDIHQQKVEQLTKDSREGLAAFFYKAGLSAYLPSPNGLATGTEQLLRQSQEMVKKARTYEKHIEEATS